MVGKHSGYAAYSLVDFSLAEDSQKWRFLLILGFPLLKAKPFRVTHLTTNDQGRSKDLGAAQKAAHQRHKCYLLLSSQEQKCYLLADKIVLIFQVNC